MNIEIGRARAQIHHFEIVVSVHADVLSQAPRHKAHIDWKGRVEGPDVDAFRIDLRFDEAKMILADMRRNPHAAHYSIRSGHSQSVPALSHSHRSISQTFLVVGRVGRYNSLPEASCVRSQYDHTDGKPDSASDFGRGTQTKPDDRAEYEPEGRQDDIREDFPSLTFGLAHPKLPDNGKIHSHESEKRTEVEDFRC